MGEHLEGIIERITYQADDTGYTVARVQPSHKGSEPVTVVGPMAAAQPGESVRLEGTWVTHPRYGRQFQFTSYTVVHPATLEGIQKYLGSGMIKGIGPVTAQRIVKHFGVDTLQIIEHDPDRLLEVPGTGPKRVESIKKGWERHKRIKDVMIFLQSHDVSTAYAVKIYKQYGDEAISLVQENPYRLERDIWGIGFVTADRIAQSVGIRSDAPERVRAGVRHALNVSSEEGHVYLPRDELIRKTQELLEVDAGLLPEALDALVSAQEVTLEEDRCYLAPLYRAECGVARSLWRILRGPKLFPFAKVDEAIGRLESQFRIQYEEAQREAIQTATQAKAMVVTGGPGTGKTTITRGIISLFEANSMRVLLCSPTGRAAKKLSETTGREARTIHRMLGYTPTGGFEHNRQRPLTADALIVDEVSMVDTTLMHSLLRAVPDHAVLVLVGDVDQLPSVGPGNVLRDLIASDALPVVRLTHIFRQAQESQIVTNAHRINRGQFPQVDNPKSGDFFFIEEDDPERIVELVRELCAPRLPERYGFHPIEDIQVLSPMYKGLTGALNLNAVLQEALNPGGQGWQRGGTAYRLGDKVMQIRNNYTKGVFNGDIGRITKVDLEAQSMEVLFDQPVGYEFSELDELMTAYAISVHKSQGSEYRAVVMPLTTQHYIMLQRNLLYTAITRARELAVLIGTKRALAIAVRNAKIAQRYSALAERLQKPQGAADLGLLSGQGTSAD